jgi:hypothetical protein
LDALLRMAVAGPRLVAGADHSSRAAAPEMEFVAEQNALMLFAAPPMNGRQPPSELAKGVCAGICFFTRRISMKRIIDRSQGPARAGLTAFAAALLLLGGCSGTGSLNTAGDGTAASSGGGGGGGGGTSGSPLAAVVREQGNTVTDLGQTASSLGGTLSKVVQPVVGDAAAQGVEGVVSHTGGVVSAVGTAVASGVGQIGKVDNPLGVSAAGLGGAVGQAGNAVSSAGDVVTGLGQNPATASLRPVTDIAGQAVDQTGRLVSRAGQGMERQLSTGPINPLLGGASTVAETAVSTGAGATQTVGTATGLGPVADRAVDPVAQALGAAGERLSGSNLPTAREVGDVVGNTSRTLSHAGDLVNGPAQGDPKGSVEQVGRALSTAIVPITAGATQVAARANDATGVGTPVGHWLVTTGGAVQQLGTGMQGDGSQPVAQGLGGIVNSSGGLVAHVGGALGGTAGAAGGGVLAPVTGAVQGLTSGGGGTGNVLAPVVGTVGALTGGLTATAGGGSSAGGAATPLTTTLTNTLGGLTGGLIGAPQR